MGNISKNDRIRNDATSSPEGAQRNGGDKNATLSERWSKLAKGGVILHRIKFNFRAKRQVSRRKKRCSHSVMPIITLLPSGRDEKWTEMYGLLME